MDSNLRAENRMLKEQLEIIVNENEKLKKKYENAVSDYEQEHYKVVKVRKYCKTMFTYGIRNNRKQAEELLEILGDKENE